MGFLRIAHRGAAGTRPEHTRPAFARALELGVDMIELDVQLTRDGQLVVVHDRMLGRTLRGEGAVREFDLAALRAMDAGAWFSPAYAGEPVLSLAEVFDITGTRAALNVEIKSPAADWDATAAALVALLRARGALAATVVSSFDMGALHALRAHEPKARIGVLWQTADLDNARAAAAALGAWSIHPWWGVIDATAVAAAHAQGLALIAWTVNEPADIARLVEMGVDGVISDFPERFIVA